MGWRSGCIRYLLAVYDISVVMQYFFSTSVEHCALSLPNKQASVERLVDPSVAFRKHCGAVSSQKHVLRDLSGVL